jgi:diacylglycerol kinase family enzyme
MDYFFPLALTDICERSLVFPERPLRCMIIVNPSAGGFIIKPRWQKCLQILNEYREKARLNPQRSIYKNVILNITEGKGSAGKLSKTFIDRAVNDPLPFYLIISAGGDGTHSEVMSALCNAPVQVRDNIAVLRLPMGTGNDNADTTDLDKALDLLINPSHMELVPAIQLITAPGGSLIQKGPFFAFNILSVGLDAYVTHKANHAKKKKPGDSYKFWLDIAALFYGCKFKVGSFDLRAFDNNKNEVLSFKEKLLLLAMGASGHRTYGSQQQILPDDRNVCGIKKMPLFRRLSIKKQVSKGKHLNSPEVICFNSHRIEFSYSHPILAQMDGETILLQSNDFPAVMELTAPVIPLLKAGKI